MDVNTTALGLISKINQIRLYPTNEGFDELVLMVAKLIEPWAPPPAPRDDALVIPETPPGKLRPSTIQRWHYDDVNQ